MQEIAQEQMIGQAIFLRHGETEYTNVFPDLTREGQQTIQRSAEKIKKILDALKKRPLLVCSPAVRARGSASIIAQYFGFRDGIRQVDLLRQAEVRDTEKGKSVFDKYFSAGGHNVLSVAYATEEEFEDPVIFEPRSEVVKRFYKYLKKLAQDFQSESIHRLVVGVSHYEVLYHFVEKFFRLDYTRDLPLTFGELIIIRFYGIPGGERQRLSVEFRGRLENDIWLV